MARLIRTEKEVEGRYEEVWIVVEEDALEQWPEGPLEIVGRDVPRVDGAGRARGQAPYTADLQLPGMLHTAVLRSPHARARVTSIDLAPARSEPGVRGVIGPGDVEQLTDEPGYVGHAVAAVAAETFDQAKAAVSRIAVEWEVLDPLLDPEEAVRQESFVSDVKTYERGDFERGVAEADEVVEAEYRTAVVLHNSLETHQAVCHWEDDGITVYISTQYIWGIREAMADRLGLPEDKVRVVCHAMGGGFGAKNGPGDYTSIAAELAKRTGRPVRCALTRREENLATGNRNATIQRLTAAAKADGTLTALGGDFINAVGFAGWSPDTDGPMQMLYACDNLRTVHYPAKLNLPPNAAFRAPGFVEGTFALECLLDELAAKLGMDPLELRQRNYADSDRIDDRPFSSKNLAECYRRAAPHWAKRDEVRARSEGPWKHGIGLASQIWYGGGGPPSYAWIRIGADARVQVVTAMQDIGTGTRTAMAQIAAEELGVSIDTSRSPSATPRAARTRRSRQARRRSRRWDRQCGRRPPTPSGSCSRSRRSGSIWRSACSTSRAARSSRRTAARGRSRRSPACSSPDRSSARVRAGRIPQACACSRSACRWRRSPSTSRRARCASTRSSPSTTSAA